MPTFQETIFIDKDIKLTVSADSTSSGYVTEVTPGEVNNEVFTVVASGSVVITSSLSAKTYLIVSELGKLTTSLTQGRAGGIGALVDDTAPQLGGDLNVGGFDFKDVNGNVILGFNPVSDAINYLEISNATGVNNTILTVQVIAPTTLVVNLELLSKGNASNVIVGNNSTGGRLEFKANVSTAGTSLVLRTDHTAERLVFLPDADTNLIGDDTTDTLTNKTIDAASNTISGVGAWSYVETKTASNSSELAFTDLTAGSYKLDISNLVPDTDGQQLRMQVSNDNGVSYVTENYQNTVLNIRPSGTNTGFVTDFAQFTVTLLGPGTGAGEFGITGEIILRVMNEANPMRYSSNLQFSDALTGGFAIEVGGGVSADSTNTGSTTNVNAARLFMQSGLFASGIVHLYEAITS